MHWVASDALPGFRRREVVAETASWVGTTSSVFGLKRGWNDIDKLEISMKGEKPLAASRIMNERPRFG